MQYYWDNMWVMCKCQQDCTRQKGSFTFCCLHLITLWSNLSRAHVFDSESCSQLFKEEKQRRWISDIEVGGSERIQQNRCKIYCRIWRRYVYFAHDSDRICRTIRKGEKNFQCGGEDITFSLILTESYIFEGINS